jgi:anti-sigma regulatory factor (Ser/Thr protein kinase)
MEGSFRFPANVDASRLARRALDGWVNDLVGPQRGDDLRLLATELISNVVRHGDVSEGEDILLDVETSESSVTVIVGQPTSVERVAMRSGEESREGGFGLQLVDRLSDEWDVHQGTPGSVWFGVLRLPEG